MLRFEGDRVFALPPEALFARLTDPAFLVECVPDVQTVHEMSSDQARLTIRPGFAFVRGSLDVSLQVVPGTAPNDARVVLLSKGIGSSANVEASLALAPAEGGTSVHWVAEVKELGGLLKMVPGGLIRGAAQKVVDQAWDRVAERLKAV